MWSKMLIFVAENTKKYACMRFIGNIEAKIDSKGRAFLPSVFRKVLQSAGEESLVLRKDVFQQCLTLYPETVWNEQMDILRVRLSRWNAAHQQIFRQFVADAELLPIDGSGRILLPKRYIALAGIEQEVRFIGMGDTIELWRGGDSRIYMPGDEFGRAIESIMSDGDEKVAE